MLIASCGSSSERQSGRGGGGEGGEGFAGLGVGQLAGAPPDGSGNVGGSGGSSAAGAGGQSAAGTSAAGTPSGGTGGAGAGGSGTVGVGAGGAGGSDAGAGGANGGVSGEAAGGAGGNALGGAGAAGGDTGPIVDVDASCLAPAVTTPLSATAEGLPAAGLALWLRADRGVYATVQQRVCAWVDQSGNDQVLYASGGNRPLWGAASLGGQPAIDFDAVSSYVSTSGVLGIAPTSGRTLIAVVQSVSTTGRFTALMQGKSGTAGTYVNLDANTFNTAGSREGVYVTNNAYDSAQATSTVRRVHVMILSTMQPGTAVLSALEYRVNGRPQTLTRTAGGLGNGNIEDFSGADFTLVGSGARAVVAEALLYDRALSAEETSSVEAALFGRYGLVDP